jgi:hypothetical protein
MLGRMRPSTTLGSTSIAWEVHVTRSASGVALVVAWLLLVAGLGAISLNPGVPSLGYAFFWLGVMAVARGISMLVTWVAVAVDLSLLLVCFYGMEIGGLILVPSIIGFVIADALHHEGAAAKSPSRKAERRL